MYFLLILYFVISAACIYTTIRNKFLIRSILKAFCLPCLILFYALFADEPNLFVILALSFSYVGDVFLIFKKQHHWCFIVGGLSFVIGHLMFAASIWTDVLWEQVQLWMFILPLIWIVCIYLSGARKLLGTVPEKMIIVTYLYLASNILLTFWCTLRLLSFVSLPHFLGITGSMLFFISDVCLFRGMYQKAWEIRSKFYVMPTYLLAMFLMTLSFFLN